MKNFVLLCSLCIALLEAACCITSVSCWIPLSNLFFFFLKKSVPGRMIKMCWSGRGASSSVYLFPPLVLISRHWVGVCEGGHLKSLFHSHKLFELCNRCWIIVRRAMCTVWVCSRHCRGVVWVDCVSVHLYLLLSRQHYLMTQSASRRKTATVIQPQ